MSATCSTNPPNGTRRGLIPGPVNRPPCAYPLSTAHARMQTSTLQVKSRRRRRLLINFCWGKDPLHDHGRNFAYTTILYRPESDQGLLYCHLTSRLAIGLNSMLSLPVNQRLCAHGEKTRPTLQRDGHISVEKTTRILWLRLTKHNPCWLEHTSPTFIRASWQCDGHISVEKPPDQILWSWKGQPVPA